MTNEELLAREGIRHTMACYTMAGDRLQTEDFDRRLYQGRHPGNG